MSLTSLFKTVDVIYVAFGAHNVVKVFDDWSNSDIEELPSIREIKIYPGYEEKDDFKYTRDIAVLTLKDSLRHE